MSALEAAIEAEKPVMLHVSEPIGHRYPGKAPRLQTGCFSSWSCIPRCMLSPPIGAEGPFYELMPEVRALTSNVVYDSAATTYLYGFQVFRAVIDLVGQERVLFASDYPVLGQHRLVRRVSSVAWADGKEAEAVMAGNAGVYGIELEGLTRT